MTLTDERSRAVDLAIGAIEKQFGRGAIMWLGGAETKVDSHVSIISSGSVGLDVALGVGGLPRGRIIEMFGPESSGKTTMARTLTDVLTSRGYSVNEARGEDLIASALAIQPDIIMLSSVSSARSEAVQTLRFEKGMENVLLFVYQ